MAYTNLIYNLITNGNKVIIFINYFCLKFCKMKNNIWTVSFLKIPRTGKVRDRQ